MTAEQLTLDSAPVVDPPVPPRPLSLDDRYRRWVEDNPHVLDEIADTARQLSDRGKRLSINRCFEEMRERVHTVGDEFVMNNSYRAPAARDVMARHADLAGVFETRRRKASR